MKRSILHSALAGLCILGAITVNGQTSLNIQAGVQLAWPTSTNNSYRPQWSPISAGSWSDLAGLLPGDGVSSVRGASVTAQPLMAARVRRLERTILAAGRW